MAILSGRSARASGFWRHAWTASGVPRRIPAWGPPNSLSPEKMTRSAPDATRSARVGSSSAPSTPKSASGSRLPLPKSSITGIPNSAPSETRSPVDAASVKPTIRKLDWWTLSSAPTRLLLSTMARR